MARFHPLKVTDVRRETRDAVVVTLARVTKTARCLTSHKASI
jgi:ferredoxin-NADP reductase